MKNHVYMLALAALIASAQTMAFEEEVATENVSIAVESCTTDSDCGCVDDCLAPAEEPDSEPRISDTLPLAIGGE